MIILSYENIEILEKVQHHATKLIQSISYIRTSSRSPENPLSSLYCCRQQGDLIETFKILTGILDATNHF